MRCPVCSAPISDISPALGDYSLIECATCGSYEITGSALHMIISKPAEEREVALRRAKRESQDGELPRISSPAFEKSPVGR